VEGSSHLNNVRVKHKVDSHRPIINTVGDKLTLTCGHSTTIIAELHKIAITSAFMYSIILTASIASS
jgi:hypothetical protein